MFDFAAFFREGAFPDPVIQMSLRDIDSELLATLLADQEAGIREAIYGNMSLRAVAYLKEEIKDPAALPPGAIEAAQEHFARLLRQHEGTWRKEGSLPPSPVVPGLDLGDRESIIRSFIALAQFVRRQGLLPLDELRTGVEHPLARQGLQMLVEGWDPLLLRSVLERSKESLLLARELEYDLIIEGIDCLASRDHALVAEQKLRSHVAGL